MTDKVMKKINQIVFWGMIVSYVTVLMSYCIGKNIAENAGLEYRYWVEVLFRCIVWYVPILMVGAKIFLFCRRQKEKRSKYSWLWSGLIMIYILAVLFISLIYMLVSMIRLSSDQKMADGNLVVGVPEGLETHYHYAEPVGIFFRRDMVFDDERVADSLSKIYGLNFQSQKDENGDAVFVASEYPDLEVRVLRYGYTKVDYLSTDLEYILTSQLLERHRNIFDIYDVELVPYVYDRTPENKKGNGTCYGVLITEKNQEDAAKAIADFIQTTLNEEIRADGESCWRNVDGSIYLVAADTETGEIHSLRNIPFSLNPKHSWVLDNNVTNTEVLKEIVNAFK